MTFQEHNLDCATDDLAIEAKALLDAVFNDGRQPQGWLQVRAEAIVLLRIALERYETAKERVDSQ